MKSAITIALAPGITYGPWVYWHHLEEGMQKAAALGFDAIELFTAGTAPDVAQVQALCSTYGLSVAAVGTGAGKVIQGLTLTHADAAVRQKAIGFIADMIDYGAAFGAPAIIGSMQGHVSASGRETTLQWLAEGLATLSAKAKAKQVPLIYEPLNRYETDLFNTVESAVSFIKAHQLENVLLLADLFHMNIEERSVAGTLEEHGEYIGHIHFADSNRRAMGMGHTDMEPIAAALRKIGYKGYLSAEVFPLPDTDAAAQQTIHAFRQWFGN